MPDRAYYSLIQYVPDRGRAEGANVGVVLVCPSLRIAHIALSDNNEGPKRRFGSKSFDDVRLSIAKESLKGRLRGDLAEHPTVDGLQRCRDLEANSLTLSEPRSMALEDGVEAAAEALMMELVHTPVKRRERARAPNTQKLLQFLEKRNVPIEKPGQVIIPITEEPLKVAFAYVNGVHNFVHSQGFSSGRSSAVEQAKKLGALGRLLYHSSEQDPLPKKLVVYAKLAEPEHEHTLHDVLNGMDVRMVPESKMEEFAQEVLKTAHHPDP